MISIRVLVIFTALAAGLQYFASGIISARAQSQQLETEKLEIITARGKFEFLVEIADEPQERTIGLMNREQLEPRGGMLFAFDQSRVISMWMKNTLIPLDMIFVFDNGTVATIAQNTVPHSLEIVSSLVPVPYVLELKGGMAALIGLKSGDKLVHRLFE